MPDLNTTLTDEQYDAIAARVTGGDVDAYMQSQHEAIAEQFVVQARRQRVVEAGLPAAVAAAGLDEDQLALVIADAAPKLEAKQAAEVAAAKALAAEALAATPAKP